MNISTPSPFPPGTQVVTYLRDSGGRTQELSVPQQENSVREWCRQNRYELTRVFADIARSAKSGIIGREQFAAMIDYMTHKPAEKGVIFWDYSRWARELKVGLKYLLDLRIAGIEVFSISDPAPTGPYGLFIETAKLMSAEDENRRRSAAVKRGMRDMISKGLSPNSHAPKGFLKKRVDAGVRRDGTPRLVSKLVPDPKTLPLVKRAFSMALEGSSLIEIMMATGLYANVSGVAYMLKNPIYKGTLFYGGTLYENFVDPLINPKMWEEVQIVRKSADEKYAPRQTASDYLLSSLVYCGECSRPAIGALAVRSTGNHTYYRCNSYRVRDIRNAGLCSCRGVLASLLEEDTVNELRKILDGPNILRELAIEQQTLFEAGDHQLNALIDVQTERIRDLDNQVRRTTNAIALYEDSIALVEKLKTLEEEKAAAREQLLELENKLHAIASVDEVEELRQDLYQRIQHADRRTLQLMLRAINTRVVFWRSLRRDATDYYAEVSFDLGVTVNRKIGNWPTV